MKVQRLSLGVRFLIMVAVVGVGFTLYGLAFGMASSEGFDWRRVLLAGLCGGFGGLIITAIERRINS